jgi:phosphopantothenoylcysteine decarboxylase/phosphopantothenate--cysteine ligase
MRILITAGPTREFIDTVRFISNSSSGLMGYAVAQEAARAGHEVTLLSGPVNLDPPEGAKLVRFMDVDGLRSELETMFPDCDVLVMAAAIGDFRVSNRSETKISRRQGPISIDLEPTEDLLAGCGRKKRAGQGIIAFSVEDGPREQIEEKARAEMAEKGADISVVNTVSAMGCDQSEACIIDGDGKVLEWGTRPKKDLAREIVSLLERWA